MVNSDLKCLTFWCWNHEVLCPTVVSRDATLNFSLLLCDISLRIKSFASNSHSYDRFLLTCFRTLHSRTNWVKKEVTEPRHSICAAFRRICIFQQLYKLLCASCIKHEFNHINIHQNEQYVSIDVYVRATWKKMLSKCKVKISIAFFFVVVAAL